MLHLPSLSIKGFRGIHALELPELGRVTLLAGVNGVGKTTVLDAIRFYASRGDGRVLLDLIDTREEFMQGMDDDGDVVLYPDFGSLFHAYDPLEADKPSPVRISAQPQPDSLSLRLVEPAKDEQPPDTLFLEPHPQDLSIMIGGHRERLPASPMAYYGPRRRFLGPPRGRAPRRPDSRPAPIHFESLGPGLLGNPDVARLWDGVVLTEAEELATDALRLVVGKRLERLTVVGEGNGRGAGRRVVAKLASWSVPVPMKRLGDGANRLLAIALALANCRGGILLMDEVENGIHYSVQANMWRMVFGAAEAANVQVIAATHSWDCVVGFAAAAEESPADGWLYRIERFEGGVEAVGYSESNLTVAARQRTEVR